MEGAPASVKPRNRRTARLAGCGALMLALAVAAWFLMHQPQLTDHAERVTNVTSYAWIDDHQILWAMPNAAHLSRIDLRTHDQRLLTDANTYADAKTWATMDVQSVAR